MLVPSGAVVVTLKPGTELSVLERDIWKEKRSLQQSLKGKFGNRDFTAMAAAPLFRTWPG